MNYSTAESKTVSSAKLKTRHSNAPDQPPAPDQSPISKQIDCIQQQLDSMGRQIGALIDATRSVLSSDPRNSASDTASESNPVSCALEGELSEFSRRLEIQIELLSAVTRNVQL